MTTSCDNVDSTTSSKNLCPQGTTRNDLEQYLGKNENGPEGRASTSGEENTMQVRKWFNTPAPHMLIHLPRPGNDTSPAPASITAQESHRGGLIEGKRTADTSEDD